MSGILVSLLNLLCCAQVPGGHLRSGEQQPGLHSTGARAAAAAGEGQARSLHRLLGLCAFSLWVGRCQAGAAWLLMAGQYLQAGQYASVFVDNGSGVALTIQGGSIFSGLLLGT